MVVALNMTDIARRKGIMIDAQRLSLELGVPVVETVGVKTNGVQALIKVLDATARPAAARESAVWHPLTAPDIEHDQTEVRRILGLVGGDRIDGVTFSDRVDCRRAASAARPPDSRGHPVPGVSGGVLHGRRAHGRDQTRRRRLRRLAAGGAACQSAEGPARRRHTRRGRQRAGVSAADHHPVLLHSGARGLRIPAARGILAGPGDGRRRVCRAAHSFPCCRASPAPFQESWRRAPSKIPATAWRPS